ncbi:GNAT family N-acetyltransferase [Aurantimonas sp. Leaf443]|uniref:GNAT family N-acetyltransferase n=1 Tax=Aurantimonas sp. Leaf443 TaxID=1736378 RepID=UPI0006FC5636|nr:GNAT family N-acetyltransferase [Aurantimonas sp. Leaf443]KQT88489.1 GNAT family acetyltransferase [Aurantimonas sp. Leaf443]
MSALQLLTTRVTSLDMLAPPRARIKVPDVSEPIVVREMPRIPLETYRALYRAVGRPHHWTSRLLPDDRLAREIHRDAVHVHVMTVGGVAAGWFELETSPDLSETRIVHFAILPAFRHRGLAPYLLAHAIHAGFGGRDLRLTIETNTLDHPSALPLYQRHGFRPFATRIVQTPAWESVADAAAGADA